MAITDACITQAGNLTAGTIKGRYINCSSSSDKVIELGEGDESCRWARAGNEATNHVSHTVGNSQCCSLHDTRISCHVMSPVACANCEFLQT
jgi:hypothetical protein